MAELVLGSAPAATPGAVDGAALADLAAIPSVALAQRVLSMLTAWPADRLGQQQAAAPPR